MIVTSGVQVTLSTVYTPATTDQGQAGMTPPHEARVPALTACHVSRDHSLCHSVVTVRCSHGCGGGYEGWLCCRTLVPGLTAPRAGQILSCCCAVRRWWQVAQVLAGRPTGAGTTASVMYACDHCITSPSSHHVWISHYYLWDHCQCNVCL